MAGTVKEALVSLHEFKDSVELKEQWTKIKDGISTYTKESVSRLLTQGEGDQVVIELGKTMRNIRTNIQGELKEIIDLQNSKFTVSELLTANGGDEKFSSGKIHETRKEFLVEVINQLKNLNKRNTQGWFSYAFLFTRKYQSNNLKETWNKITAISTQKNTLLDARLNGFEESKATKKDLENVYVLLVSLPNQNPTVDLTEAKEIPHTSIDQFTPNHKTALDPNYKTVEIAIETLQNELNEAENVTAQVPKTTSIKWKIDETRVFATKEFTNNESEILRAFHSNLSWKADIKIDNNNVKAGDPAIVEVSARLTKLWKNVEAYFAILQEIEPIVRNLYQALAVKHPGSYGMVKYQTDLPSKDVYGYTNVEEFLSSNLSWSTRASNISLLSVPNNVHSQMLLIYGPPGVGKLHATRLGIKKTVDLRTNATNTAHEKFSYIEMDARKWEKWKPTEYEVELEKMLLLAQATNTRLGLLYKIMVVQHLDAFLKMLQQESNTPSSTPLTSTIMTSRRMGGDADAKKKTGGTEPSRLQAFQAVLNKMFTQEYLYKHYPNVVLIFVMEEPWQMPEKMREQFNVRREYVGFPNTETRQNVIRTMIKDKFQGDIENLKALRTTFTIPIDFKTAVEFGFTQDEIKFLETSLGENPTDLTSMDLMMNRYLQKLSLTIENLVSLSSISLPALVALRQSGSQVLYLYAQMMRENYAALSGRGIVSFGMNLEQLKKFVERGFVYTHRILLLRELERHHRYVPIEAKMANETIEELKQVTPAMCLGDQALLNTQIGINGSPEAAYKAMTALGTEGRCKPINPESYMDLGIRPETKINPLAVFRDYAILPEAVTFASFEFQRNMVDHEDYRKVIQGIDYAFRSMYPNTVFQPLQNLFRPGMVLSANPTPSMSMGSCEYRFDTKSSLEGSTPAIQVVPTQGYQVVQTPQFNNNNMMNYNMNFNNMLTPSAPPLSSFPTATPFPSSSFTTFSTGPSNRLGGGDYHHPSPVDVWYY